MAVSVPAYLMHASIVEERVLPSPQWGICDEGRYSPAPLPGTGPRRFAAPACYVLDGQGVIRFRAGPREVAGRGGGHAPERAEAIVRGSARPWGPRSDGPREFNSTHCPMGVGISEWTRCRPDQRRDVRMSSLPPRCCPMSADA